MHFTKCINTVHYSSASNKLSRVHLHFICYKNDNDVFIYVKTVQFTETLYKGDIVVRDTKQQRSIFHHYKISSFAVTHRRTLLTMYNHILAITWPVGLLQIFALNFDTDAENRVLQPDVLLEFT